MTDEREAELLAIIAQKDAEIKLLRQKVDLLVRKVFGSSSEKLDAAQLEMLLGTEPGKAPAPGGDAPEKQEKVRPRSSEPESRSRKARLPEHLPVVEEVVDPLEVQEAPQDWKQIGEEVSEQLDYQPGKYFRRRLVRRKVSVQRNALLTGL